MHMLTLERVPEFMPEPPFFDSEDDVFAEETPFEVYVYFSAFRVQPKTEIGNYLKFFEKYTEVTPGFEGPDAEESDVLFPGAEPIDYPYYYNRLNSTFCIKMAITNCTFLQGLMSTSFPVAISTVTQFESHIWERRNSPSWMRTKSKSTSRCSTET